MALVIFEGTATLTTPSVILTKVRIQSHNDAPFNPGS